MPVTDVHPDYQKFRPLWVRIQDVMDGEDAVRFRGTVYLPKINSKQEDDDYRAYSQRACFFNGTKRTSEAMSGFIFRKPPTIKTSMGKDFTEDVDMRGATLAGYCRKVTSAACSKGRAGTLIDWNEQEARPYLSYYAAEDIINWNVSRVSVEGKAAGRMALTLLVLRDRVTVMAQDGFEGVQKEQYIVLRMSQDGQSVTMEKWEADAPLNVNDNTVQPTPGAKRIVDPVQMGRIGGSAPKDIPFVFHNADEPGPAVSVPPLNDIATVNIHHFQASAELENARFMCAIPTPWAVGFGNNDSKMYMGTRYAWTTQEIGATCGMLEPTGNGLASLEKSLEEKQAAMAALGARLIEPPMKDAKSEQTVRIEASAETSTLARINQLTSEGLSEVMQWAAWWANPGKKNRTDFRDTDYVALNTDYVSAKLTPQELTALVAARQQDAISWETFFFKMKEGEMYPDGTTIEEEMKNIKKTPAMPPVSGFDEAGNPIHGNPPPEPKPEPEPAK